MANNSVKSTLRIIAAVGIAIAGIYATCMAILSTIIVNQAGTVLNAQKGAVHVIAGASALQTFAVSFFIGLGFLFFFSLLSLGWVAFLGWLFSKPEQKKLGRYVAWTLAGLVGSVGLFSGITSALAVNQLLYVVHTSSGARLLATLLTGAVSFGQGLFMGLIGCTVLGGGLFVLAVFWAFITNGKGGSKPGDTPKKPGDGSGKQ